MKWIFIITLVNCICSARECEGKYVISANESVTVQNCDLTSVQNISLHNSRVEELIFQSCSIDELPNALFIRFRKLRILEITESQLGAISDFAFNGLSSLQLLNLSRNNLTSIKTWSNENLEALSLLDLRRNAIASIHKHAFSHYPNLLKLNLAVNHMSELPDDMFFFIPHLKNLNLAKNHLESIEAGTFRHLHKLLHLELRSNQIKFVDAEAFVGCTHMKILHLQDNQLSSFVVELISNMPRLHHLNISHNLLADLADETFAKNEELVSLDISHNRFESFSELTFKGLEVLEVFNASNNAIRLIDSTIFKDFAYLLLLELGNNQLQSLPKNAFETMSRLKSIGLHNNSLDDIEEGVFSKLQLKYLDLSCNSLESDHFLWDSKIEHLNLTFNEFQDINTSLLENTETDFWGNPFICEWLVKEGLASKSIRLGKNYVVDSSHNILKAEGILCFDEEGLEERRLIVVESKSKAAVNEEVEVLEGSHRNSKNALRTETATDDFDYYDTRSILLWLSCGCLAVFAGLRLLKCLLNKSESQSEEYRLSRRSQAQSMNDELSYVMK